MATAENWYPADPVQKLESTIKNFARIFDAVSMRDNRAAFDQHVSFLEQEVEFLLQVLSRATHRADIDLTVALSLAMEAVADVTYRLLKETLQAAAVDDLMLTRSAFAEDPSHWMYIPLRELVLLHTARLPHIHIDINALSIENPLESAIKSKSYSLLPIFIALGSTALRRALHTSVTQGDDRAVEVLLRLARGARLDSSSNGVVQCIEESLALAQQLRFDHIERRLRWALDIASSGDGRAIIDTSLLAAADEFLPCNDKQQTQEQSSASNADVYPDAEREREKESYSRSGDASLPVIGLCECAIDRIDIADLDASRFHRDYVRLNRAVAIRGSIGPDAAARWTVDNLLRDFGHIQVIAGPIPYATLFGRRERVVSLQSYVEHPEYGMRAYSRPNGSSSVFSPEDPPLYLFSGPEQEISRALHGHMWELLTTFRSLSDANTNNRRGSAAAGDNHLIELMLSIRRAGSYSKDDVEPLNPGTFPTAWKSQFFLGPPYSGAPFHHHGPAFNVVVSGRKRWTLLPPSRDLYSNVHPLAWIHLGGVDSALYPYRTAIGGRPCDFVQEAGEVLFVPRHWTHQVLNLYETVGFAIEV